MNATDNRGDERLERYRRVTDFPLVVLSVAVIPLLLIEVEGDLSATVDRVIEWTYAVIWVAFVADYVIELWLVTDRRRYVRQEWFALLVNVLTVPLPFLPPQLQLLRTTRVVRLLRLVRVGAAASRGGRAVLLWPRSSQQRLMMAMTLFVTVTLVSAVLVLAAEEGHRGADITGFGDALWWSLGTITTVGYGDVVPVTPLGRILAIPPIIAGIGLIGVVAGNLAGRMFERLEQRIGHDLTSTVEEQGISRVESKLDGLLERIAALEDRLEGSSARAGVVDEGED